MSMSYEEIQRVLTAPGQPFEMEQVEIEGRAVRCWKNAPHSMAAILEQSRDHGETDFVVYAGERLTFAAHYDGSAAIALHLVNEFGIRKGDRVAIAMRNYPEWCMAFWGAVSAGAVVVPLNAWWTGEELAYGLRDSGARVVFADRERLERLQPVRPGLTELEYVVAVRCENPPAGTRSIEQLLRGAGAGAALPAVPILPDDLATLFYTSGSTGFPKGTLGTHRNFCSVIPTMRYSGLRSMLRAGLTFDDVNRAQQVTPAALLPVPLFHVTGCHGTMLGMMSAGGKLVMMHRWDPLEALDLIERERVTMVVGVPTMAQQLVDATGSRQCDLSSVLNLGYGGAPAPPEMFRRIRAALPSAVISTGWGITETSATISMVAGDDYEDKPDSVGPTFPVFDVKVVDDTGAELPRGELGELWVRGPNVARGYWNQPEATAESFADGWFHTGDVGRMDEEGFIYIVDRLKDMIIRGGENIYCAEVEAVLVEHPAVRVACVFGVPDAVLGEEVACVVEVVERGAVSEQALRDHVAGRLARFKVPSHIWTRAEPLPLGATGKVQKRELRAHYLSRL